MPSSDRTTLLRQLPAVDRLLQHTVVLELLAEFPRESVKQALQGALAAARRAILGGAPVPAEDSLAEDAATALRESDRPHLVRAVNATGIVLHTGLGRAVLPGAAIDAIAERMRGYCVLAADRETGERFDRNRHVAARLCALTGAEAATFVNNNAGATLLVLAALAKGRDAIVSRGQLVEIGGSFRLPDIMAEAGAHMVEVGTTNRTHLFDYERALTPQAAIILRVHTANYRQIGFTAEVSTRELADLAHAHGCLMVDDIGSGALFGLERWGLEHEHTAQESLADGADVVLFSGDKLLGGPQCGVLLGRKDLIEVIRKHPLARAMRMDKLRLCALEETLRLLANPERIEETIPTYAMLSRPLDELRAQAEALAERIRQAQPAVRVTAREDVTYVGSGSLPARPFPSWVVVLSCPNLSASRLGLYLRQGEPPIYGRIQHDEVLLDVRTLQPGEDEEIVAALGRMEGGACGRCGAKPTLSPG
jgi:L-seryl-tRNA(Ser) seleniumtransferase